MFLLFLLETLLLSEPKNWRFFAWIEARLVPPGFQFGRPDYANGKDLCVMLELVSLERIKGFAHELGIIYMMYGSMWPAIYGFE
jgi:hypothetical protein